MSTPISDIHDDMDFLDEDDDEPLAAPVRELPSKRKSKKYSNYFAQYKEYLLIYFAAALALKIPIDTFAYRVPTQVFAFGDIPIRALLIVLAIILSKYLMRLTSF
jgi:hypothetical protein